MNPDKIESNYSQMILRAMEKGKQNSLWNVWISNAIENGRREVFISVWESDDLIRSIFNEIERKSHRCKTIDEELNVLTNNLDIWEARFSKFCNVRAKISNATDSWKTDQISWLDSLTAQEIESTLRENGEGYYLWLLAKLYADLHKELFSGNLLENGKLIDFFTYKTSSRQGVLKQSDLKGLRALLILDCINNLPGGSRMEKKDEHANQVVLNEEKEEQPVNTASGLDCASQDSRQEPIPSYQSITRDMPFTLRIYK